MCCKFQNPYLSPFSPFSLLFNSLSLFIFSIFSSASPNFKISISTILFYGTLMAKSPWLHQPLRPTLPPPIVLAHVTSYLKAFSSLSLAQMWLIYIWFDFNVVFEMHKWCLWKYLLKTWFQCNVLYGFALSWCVILDGGSCFPYFSAI